MLGYTVYITPLSGLLRKSCSFPRAIPIETRKGVSYGRRTVVVHYDLVCKNPTSTLPLRIHTHLPFWLGRNQIHVIER